MKPNVVDANIPDLVRSLTGDSSRLLDNELRLAKLEARQAAHDAFRGGIWMAIAFGAAVIALAAATVLLSVVLGRLTGNMWAGALITGVLELLVGGLLLRRSLALFQESESLTMDETRAEAVRTISWARDQLTS